jgi:hypothetical protein
MSDLQLAERHVRDGQRIVDRQTALVLRLQRRGFPTELAESLLANLVDSLGHMRRHEDAIRLELRDAP